MPRKSEKRRIGALLKSWLDRRPRSFQAAAGAALLLAAVWLYWPGLRSPSAGADSYTAIFAQPVMDDWAGLSRLPSRDYFRVFGESGYRPMSTLAAFLSRRAAGADLLGYKLIKLALHLINALLLYLFLVRELGARRWAVFGAAAYFARTIPPVLTGASFIHDALSASFCLAALLAHRPRSGGRFEARRTGAALGLYACALLSKETALLLPGALLLHWLIFPPAGKGWKRTMAIEQAVLWGWTAAHLAYLRWAVRASSFYGPLDGDWPSLAEPVTRLAGYWSTFFVWWPVPLLACAFLLGSGGRETRRRLGRWLAFAAGWSAFALIPVLGILPFSRFGGYFGAPEPRYLAFAGAGLAGLAALLGLELDKRGWRRGAALALAACVLVPAVLSTRIDAASRLRGSRGAPLESVAGEDPAGAGLLSLPFIRASDPELFASALGELSLRTSRENARDIAEYFGDAELLRDPWKARRALRLHGVRPLERLAEGVRAERDFEKGKALLVEGRFEAALASFRRTRAADPEHSPACMGEAEALAGLGRESRALLDECSRTEDAESMRWGHWRTETRMALAERLAARGRYYAALEEYSRLLAAAPPLWPGRGPALERMLLLESGARAAFDRAIRAFKAGNRAGALAELSRSLAASPEHVEALVIRGALLAEAGRWAEAAEDYGRALRNPSLPPIQRAALLTSRSEALKRLGRDEEAARDPAESRKGSKSR